MANGLFVWLFFFVHRESHQTRTNTHSNALRKLVKKKQINKLNDRQKWWKEAENFAYSLRLQRTEKKTLQNFSDTIIIVLCVIEKKNKQYTYDIANWNALQHMHKYV